MKIYKKMPSGWIFVQGATTAPVGYRWICNNKSRFSGKRKSGIIFVG